MMETIHGVWNPRTSQEEQVAAARNAIAACKNALVEASWCRILTAAGYRHLFLESSVSVIIYHVHN